MAEVGASLCCPMPNIARHDQVVDEQPLLVEPGDAFGIPFWDLVSWDSPGGDPDRVVERDGLSKIGERCIVVESGVGDDHDIGREGVDECEDAGGAWRQDVTERVQSC